VKRPGALFTAYLVGAEAVALATSLVPTPLDDVFAGVIALIGVLAWIGQRRVAAMVGTPAALILGTTAITLRFVQHGSRPTPGNGELFAVAEIIVFSLAIVFATLWLVIGGEDYRPEHIPTAKVRR
jgi:hypothetical protein